MRTQYTLKKGLQVFGPPGVEAVYKELQQLHECKVGKPRDASTLSPLQEKCIGVPHVSQTEANRENKRTGVH